MICRTKQWRKIPRRFQPNRVVRHLIFLNAFYRRSWIVGMRSNVPSAFLHSRGPTGGDLGRTQATSAGAALPTISDRPVEREEEESMRATFRRLAVATVLAATAATVVLPGTAEARWGWRAGGWGWGGFGIGLGTGLLLAAATRPYYAGYYGYTLLLRVQALRIRISLWLRISPRLLRLRILPALSICGLLSLPSSLLSIRGLLSLSLVEGGCLA
jgi:hypothetical protein